MTLGVVLLILMTAIQATLWGFASLSAGTAARAAAQAAAAEGSSAGQGQAVGNAVLSDGSMFVSGGSVDVSRGEEVTSATVVGTVAELVPVPWDMQVVVQADVPTERFIPAGER